LNIDEFKECLRNTEIPNIELFGSDIVISGKALKTLLSKILSLYKKHGIDNMTVDDGFSLLRIIDMGLSISESVRGTGISPQEATYIVQRLFQDSESENA